MRKFIYLEDIEYKIYVRVCLLIILIKLEMRILNSWKYSRETIVNNK